MTYDGNGEKYASWRMWLLRLFGVVLLVIGAILAVGGAKLILLGGSHYYALIGVVLCVAGIMALLGRVGGLHVYILGFVLTFFWALWEAGFNGSPVRRAGFLGLRRNLAVAMGNSGLSAYTQILTQWAETADEGLRKAAVWALRKVQNKTDANDEG